jgi:hypothetical protein
MHHIVTQLQIENVIQRIFIIVQRLILLFSLKNDYFFTLK